MGKKHTSSLKLIKIGNWNNINYGKRIINQEYKEKQVKKIIGTIFKEWASITEPVFVHKLNEVKIIIYYWTPYNNIISFKEFEMTISQLTTYISKLFGLTVRLDIVYLNRPFLSSNILAEFIGINIRKYTLVKIGARLTKAIGIKKEIKGSEISYNYKNIKSGVLHKTLKSYISGIKCVLSGRIMKRKSANRSKKQIFNKGSFHFNSFPSLIDYRNAYILPRGIGGKYIKNGSIGIKIFINNSISLL